MMNTQIWYKNYTQILIQKPNSQPWSDSHVSTGSSTSSSTCSSISAKQEIEMKKVDHKLVSWNITVMHYKSRRCKLIVNFTPWTAAIFFPFSPPGKTSAILLLLLHGGGRNYKVWCVYFILLCLLLVLYNFSEKKKKWGSCLNIGAINIRRCDLFLHEVWERFFFVELVVYEVNILRRNRKYD